MSERPTFAFCAKRTFSQRGKVPCRGVCELPQPSLVATWQRAKDRRRERHWPRSTKISSKDSRRGICSSLQSFWQRCEPSHNPGEARPSSSGMPLARLIDRQRAPFTEFHSIFFGSHFASV